VCDGRHVIRDRMTLTIEIAPLSDSLSECTPNLMPFHIDYSGPAPISTYFRCKDGPSRVGAPTSNVGNDPKHAELTPSLADANTTTNVAYVEGVDNTEASSNPVHVSPQENVPSASAEPAADHARRLKAAFRGRTVHGLQVDLPAGYGGIILRADSAAGSKVPVDAVKAKVTRAQKNAGASDKERTRGNAMRSSAKAMDMDDFDDFIPNGEDSAESDSSRRLQPTETFTSFVLWQPDYPVDEGKDEYCRSLTEWTRLVAQVRKTTVIASPSYSPFYRFISLKT
jgi:Ribonuclease H2 non-catalytic subunit (Ylr154p-like)